MTNTVLRARIYEILNDAHTARINFVIGGHRISSELYAAVRRALDSGDIDVISSGSRRRGAYYESDNAHHRNRFLMSVSCINTDTLRALVVHEATHAGCDVQNLSAMPLDTSEAAAYLAQCIYLRDVYGPQRSERDRLRGSTPASDRIFESAWEMAGYFIRNGFIHHYEMEDLRKRIRLSPEYNPSHAMTMESAGWDGV